MKTLGKKLLAFWVAVCLITPLLAQSAYADAGAVEVVEDAVQVTMDYVTAEQIDELEANSEAEAYALVTGTRVLNIYIYPVAQNLDTGAMVTKSGLYKKVTFASSGQSEGLYLTKEQTASLINQMKNYLNTLSGNYKMYGWRIAGTVRFTYDSLDYLTYQKETISYKSPETRIELRGSSYTHTFSEDIPYPTGVDLENDYYYARIRGVCYFENSLGNPSNALFMIAGGFN